MEHIKKLMITVNTIIQRSNEMTREEYKKEIFNEYSSTKVYKSAKKYIKSLEAQLKAKDEEIERLKEALEVLTVMCELGIKTQDKYSKIIQKMKVLNKARSIVAMLFLEWKKITRLAEGETMDEYADGYACGCVAQAEQLFKKAYKMLKDSK